MSETNEVKKSATRKKKPADLPFEAAIARLEEIVKAMEGLYERSRLFL